mgnify:CR=1 FL=1
MWEKVLPRNENITDRVIRVVLGAVLVALAFVGPQTPWGWLGLILIVTGALGRCPLYALFGMSTRRAGPAEGA